MKEIAVASDYSFIAPSATMTIHPVRLTGMVIGVPATMEYMERMQDRVVAFVTVSYFFSNGTMISSTFSQNGNQRTGLQFP